MQQWECIVCGWVYDEKVGDPDSGIAPGTKFEDIPDDWLCPECGVGKDDFELIDIPEPAAETSEQSVEITETPNIAKPLVKKPSPEFNIDESFSPIVIIGSGLAGYTLAREFRKLDQHSPLIIITADDGRVYSKPALSTGYTKGTSADDLSQLDAGSLATELGVSIWTNTKVSAIDSESQSISISDGSVQIKYRKLVLAQGANCIEPPLAGNAVDKVLTINDLQDFAQFQYTADSRRAKRVCIIGAGLIGCEYTNDLINGGFEVDVIDPMATCLPTLLPSVAGNAIQSALEQAGATFHFGRLAKEVNQTDSGVEVVLDDGQKIHADLVLSAVGVKPNIELAVSAGLQTGRGIKVNRYLQSSDENIYALGDCAEVEGLVLVYVTPLMIGSRALAQTLSGSETAISYPAMPVAIKTPCCPTVVCPPPSDSEGEWKIINQNDHHTRSEFVNENDDILGYALTGDYCAERGRYSDKLPNWLD